MKKIFFLLLFAAFFSLGIPIHAYYLSPRDYMDDPDEALDAAYAEGLSDGYDEGYYEGYDVGYDEGYSIGYNWGMDDEDNNNAFYDIGYDDGYFDAKEGKPKATQPPTTATQPHSTSVLTTAQTTSATMQSSATADASMRSVDQSGTAEASWIDVIGELIIPGLLILLVVCICFKFIKDRLKK